MTYEIVSDKNEYKTRVEADGGTIVSNTCIPYSLKEKVSFNSLA